MGAEKIIKWKIKENSDNNMPPIKLKNSTLHENLDQTYTNT